MSTILLTLCSTPPRRFACLYQHLFSVASPPDIVPCPSLAFYRLPDPLQWTSEHTSSRPCTNGDLFAMSPKMLDEDYLWWDGWSGNLLASLHSDQGAANMNMEINSSLLDIINRSSILGDQVFSVASVYPLVCHGKS